jgi:2-dehydro-3-deoxygluconokinase
LQREPRAYDDQSRDVEPVSAVPRIVFAGEAMLELAQADAGWQVRYGGDTLNTAIHLARAGRDVGYLTALGNDALSAGMAAGWATEGLDLSLVLEHPQRSTGLYAISTDAAGERSFAYWRDTSAAREMFALPGAEAACAAAATAGLFGFSLISLAILPDEGRSRLLALASEVRANGGRVAFDGNFRARLWPSLADAARWRNAAVAVADIGLPTLEDETALSGETDAATVAAHWQGLGCGEVLVKLGAEGCRLPGGTIIAPGAVLAPVDTSGAGDAFNAGYLGARLDGAEPAAAARAGHALAGWTIMRRGAIPPRD